MAGQHTPRIVLAHTVLRSALKWAMTQRVMTYNPAALVKVPKATAGRTTPLSADQARRLIEAPREHRLGAMVLGALLTAAGLPAMKYHGLRHTAATLLLTDGARSLTLVEFSDAPRSARPATSTATSCRR
jgi:site-specific recombinase XerD